MLDQFRPHGKTCRFCPNCTRPALFALREIAKEPPPSVRSLRRRVVFFVFLGATPTPRALAPCRRCAPSGRPTEPSPEHLTRPMCAAGPCLPSRTHHGACACACSPALSPATARARSHLQLHLRSLVNLAAHSPHPHPPTSARLLSSTRVPSPRSDHVAAPSPHHRPLPHR